MFDRDNESVTLDSRVFGDSAGQGGNVVGKVASVEGQVFAKGPDGSVRQLKVGDPVYEGDSIVTSASGRAHVARLVDEGLVDLRSERLVLTQRGRLLADGVVRDLVGDPLG